MFFSPSHYCDLYERYSLGGLYIQNFTDNIYICKKILKAQKYGHKKGKHDSHTSPATWNKNECLITTLMLSPSGSTFAKVLPFLF